MKKLIVLLALFTLSFQSYSQDEQDERDKNEIFLHLDYPEGIGGSYARNIGKFYTGLDVFVATRFTRNVPEFTGNLLAGVRVWKFIPFVTGGFYTCGGEAKREGEGKQGFDYGVGLSGQYRKVKLQVELTDQVFRVSLGLVVSTW